MIGYGSDRAKRALAATIGSSTQSNRLCIVLNMDEKIWFQRCYHLDRNLQQTVIGVDHEMAIKEDDGRLRVGNDKLEHLD